MDSDTLQQIIQYGGEFAVVIGIVLAIEWVFLPMAVFGIKSKLDGIRDAIDRSNDLLEKIAQQPAPPQAPWQLPKRAP